MTNPHDVKIPEGRIDEDGFYRLFSSTGIETMDNEIPVTITVGKLKKLLEDYPDNMPLLVHVKGKQGYYNEEGAYCEKEEVLLAPITAIDFLSLEKTSEIIMEDVNHNELTKEELGVLTQGANAHVALTVPINTENEYVDEDEDEDDEDEDDEDEDDEDEDEDDEYEDDEHEDDEHENELPNNQYLEEYLTKQGKKIKQDKDE